MKPAIRVENLSKKYRLGSRTVKDYSTLREKITESVTAAWQSLHHRLRGAGNGKVNGTAKDCSFWALKDVSFEVQPGEVVGIIGRNGAGKSTLLKILSRIVEPTAGHCEARGRLASLLEVGTGFHPELTGRENIYLNGSLLGMSRKEMDLKFDEIVAFSEIEQFLDTPVKRYSSGMYVRLAFAIAAHLQTEILIVDEVLAVGDYTFQKKCMGKMQTASRSGRTVLFVSHNMPAVESLCSRALVMKKGRLILQDNVAAALAKYYELEECEVSGEGDLRAHAGRTEQSMPVMNKVTIKSQRENLSGVIEVGSPFAIEVEYDQSRITEDPHLGMVIKTTLGGAVFWTNSRSTRTSRNKTNGGSAQHGKIKCEFDYCPLMPGLYYCDLYFGGPKEDVDTIMDAFVIEVRPRDVLGTGKLPHTSAGPMYFDGQWIVTEA